MQEGFKFWFGVFSKVLLCCIVHGCICMEFHLLFPVELNKFSDMTFEEFQSRYLMQLQNCSATSGKHVISNQPLPEHKDWRDEGKYVTPAQTQVNSNFFF